MATSTVTHETLAENTSAKFVANLQNGSLEWLELRQSGIGGSDAGTILGVNKYASPFSLWAEKTGTVESRFEGNRFTEWGTRLESVIIDKFEETHDDLELLRDPGTWTREDNPWMLANPDAVFRTATGEWGILEIKTASRADEWRDNIPASYYAQVQFYLTCFGFKKAVVAVLIGGNDYREYDIDFDATYVDNMMMKCREFHSFIMNAEAPDFDGHSATLETVRVMHPEITDEIVALEWLGVELIAANSRFDEAQAELNKVKSHVASAMGFAKHGTIDGNVIVSRQARGTGVPYLVIKSKGN